VFKTEPSASSAAEPPTTEAADEGCPASWRQPTWRIVLVLALPVLVQQFLVLSVGLSDRFLAGRLQPVPLTQRAEAVAQQLLALTRLGNGGGQDGLAAVLAAEAPWELARQTSARQVAYQSAQTTANYLAWCITCYTILVSVGGTALVARFTGAGDHRLAIHATNQAVLLALLLGLLGGAVGLLGLDRLVDLLGLRGPAAVFAVEYLRPLLVLLVFQMVEVAGIACLVGAGDTRTGLWVMMGVALVNVPLAWGFFLGIGPLRELGFTGIAVGTAVSHFLGAVAVLTVLARGRAGLWLRPRLLWPDASLLRRLLRVGVPAGVDSLSVAACQLWFLSIVNRLGDTASSAHGIALGWEALAYQSGHAFGTAAMALVGQNLGAGRPAQAARSGWVAFGLGGGVMCLMGAIFYTLAPEMFALFCPHPEQRGIITEGVPVLRLVAFATPAMASMIIFTAALRGAGDTRVPVLFTWIGFLVVRIPLAYVLTLERLDLGPLGTWPGANLGLLGAWLAMFGDLLVRGGFFLQRFATGRWQSTQV
jgi:putative MATE family efflux protein